MGEGDEFTVPANSKSIPTRLRYEEITPALRDRPSGTRAWLWDVCGRDREDVAIPTAPALAGQAAATIPHCASVQRF